MKIKLSQATAKGKKLKAEIYHDDGSKKTIQFGAEGMSDYTKHKDDARKARYIARHSKEDHTKKNIESAAFMSRWLLWNKPTVWGSK